MPIYYTGVVNRKKGFTLIEMMIFLFIFSVIAITFYNMFNLGMNYSLEAKKRLTAVALANEKLEVIRNLEYEFVGTEDNPPYGEVLSEETVNKGGRDYYIFTTISYVDDPFDGIEDGTPDDAIPNDYKEVKVKVAWENNVDTGKAISMSSYFSPIGVEVPVSGGTLSVHVLDAEGMGIDNIKVSLENTGKSIDTYDYTDSNGNATFVGYPADGQNYAISISGGDYYPIQSLPVYPITAGFSPVEEHAAIVESRLSVVSMITDIKSDLTINSKDYFGTAIPSVPFDLKGGKKIGDTVVVEPEVSQFVYDYDQNNLSTGSDGKKVLSGRCFGNYIYNPDSLSGYQFLHLSPSLNTINSFYLPPNTNTDVDAVYLDESINSLLVTVKDETGMTSAPDDDLTPIVGATVQLKDKETPTVYDVTHPLPTDQFGQVYFPVTLPELVSGNYDLKVTMPGYADETVEVNINNLTSQVVRIEEN